MQLHTLDFLKHFLGLIVEGMDSSNAKGGKLVQLQINFDPRQRDDLLKEVVFPHGIKIDHSKLASVMNRIASFAGQPRGNYESKQSLMKFCKLTQDQVERALTALRKLNLLNELEPEWDPRLKRVVYPKFIHFDELQRMVARQRQGCQPPPHGTETTSARAGEDLRTRAVPPPHETASTSAPERADLRTQMRPNSITKETPPHQSDWSGVEESLRNLGVLKANEAMRSAQQRGCSLEHCNELIDYFRKRVQMPDHGWQAPAYVLLRRFMSASPSTRVEDGWFGSGPRSVTQATQRESNLQRTKELLARIHVPAHERSKGFSESDRAAIASLGR